MTASLVEMAKARVRAYARHRGWSASEFAERAGLHRNTLRHFDLPEWNPTAETLARLEAIVPSEFAVRTRQAEVEAA